MEDSVSLFLETGSREAFERLAREWLPSLRRFLFVHLGADLHACEEVQQEILLVLWEKLAGFDGRSQFSTFLYRLARNKAIDHIRRIQRHRRHQVSLDGDGELEAGQLSSDPRLDPLESLVRTDTAQRLFLLLLELPLADRELLHFREVEQMSEKDCSLILKLPVGTLKSRLHRIKKKLYQQLNPEGDRP